MAHAYIVKLHAAKSRAFMLDHMSGLRSIAWTDWRRQCARLGAATDGTCGSHVAVPNFTHYLAKQLSAGQLATLVHRASLLISDRLY
jgi:hypothetical protein